MIRALFAPLAMKISAGLILALALFAGVQTLRLSWAQAEIADIKREAAENAARAVTSARQADSAAQTTVDAEKASTGAEIDRAREAAAGSDDPWKAAADSMRKSK